MLLARYALASRFRRLVRHKGKDVAPRIPIDREGLRRRVDIVCLLAGDVNEDCALGDLGRPSVGTPTTRVDPAMFFTG